MEYNGGKLFVDQSFSVQNIQEMGYTQNPFKSETWHTYSASTQNQYTFSNEWALVVLEFLPDNTHIY